MTSCANQTSGSDVCWGSGLCLRAEVMCCREHAQSDKTTSWALSLGNLLNKTTFHMHRDSYVKVNVIYYFEANTVLCTHCIYESRNLYRVIQQQKITHSRFIIFRDCKIFYLGKQSKPRRQRHWLSSLLFSRYIMNDSVLLHHTTK